MSMTQQPACFIMGTATDGRARTHRHTRIHTEQLSLCLPLLYPFRRPQCPNHHDRDSCVCEIETENGRVFVTGACAWNDNSLFHFLFSLQLQLPFFWHFHSHYPHICNALDDCLIYINTWLELKAKDAMEYVTGVCVCEREWVGVDKLTNSPPLLECRQTETCSALLIGWFPQDRPPKHQHTHTNTFNRSLSVNFELLLNLLLYICSCLYLRPF